MLETAVFRWRCGRASVSVSGIRSVAAGRSSLLVSALQNIVVVVRVETGRHWRRCWGQGMGQGRLGFSGIRRSGTSRKHGVVMETSLVGIHLLVVHRETSLGVVVSRLVEELNWGCWFIIRLSGLVLGEVMYCIYTGAASHKKAGPFATSPPW